MTVGDIIDRGLKLLFARLPAFYIINLIVLSPLIAYEVASPLMVETEIATNDPMAGVGMVGAGLLVLLLTLIL
jgi:hypothetical protein